MEPTSYLQHLHSVVMFLQADETPLGWYVSRPFQQTMKLSKQICVQHMQTVSLDILKWYDADINGVKPSAIYACEDEEIKKLQFLKHVRKNHQTVRRWTDKSVSLLRKEGFLECFTFNRDQAL